MNGLHRQVLERLLDEEDGVFGDVIRATVIDPKDVVVLLVGVDVRAVADSTPAEVVVRGNGDANGPGEQKRLRNSVRLAMLWRMNKYRG